MEANPSAPTAPSAELTELRAKLDVVDHQLLEIVRERIEICEAVAHVKVRGDIPMMQPNRMQVVHDRAQAFAEEHGISSQFVRSLYELIIEETCRVEDLIIDGGSLDDQA